MDRNLLTRLKTGLTRPQYSIRTLLIVTSLLGLIFFYHFVLPTARARRLVSALQAGDLAAVRQMVTNREDLKWKSLMFETDFRVFVSTVGLEPLDTSQLVRGTRTVYVELGQPSQSGSMQIPGGGEIVTFRVTSREVALQSHEIRWQIVTPPA